MDDGLAESISSILWVAPRMQTDVAELKVISDLLAVKYGKQYADVSNLEILWLCINSWILIMFVRFYNFCYNIIEHIGDVIDRKHKNKNNVGFTVCAASLL